MNSYIATEAWDQLLNELEGAFMAAASGMGDLRGKIAEALAVAGVMPEDWREDEPAEVVA